MFDDVKIAADPYNTGFKLEFGRTAVQFATPITKAAISATASAPRRAISRCRRRIRRRTCAAKCSAAMAKMGAKVEKHHHEVASAQHELGLKFSPLTTMADQLQVYKYCIHQVAQIYGKTATFMPKPVYRRQRLGHALPSVDLERRQAGVRRQQIFRSVGNLPLVHRRHHQARQGDERLHQPDHQLLQASGAGLRGAGAARLFGAQPFGVVPHPLHRPTRRRSASKCASPIRWPIRISPSRRC